MPSVLRLWAVALLGWIPERTIHLLDAAGFIATLQKRQGLMVACPEEIAYRQGWISAEDVQKVASQFSKNSYGQYLTKILNELKLPAHSLLAYQAKGKAMTMPIQIQNCRSHQPRFRRSNCGT